MPDQVTKSKPVFRDAPASEADDGSGEVEEIKDLMERLKERANKKRYRCTGTDFFGDPCDKTSDNQEDLCFPVEI